MKSLLFSVIAVLLLTAVSSAQNVPSYVPTNGLVGWWPFNGNANDESGNGNHGTVNGATLTSDRFGNLGKAYSFDGVSTYIIGNANSFPTSSRTVSLWFFANDIGTGSVGGRGLFGYGGQTCGQSWIEHVNITQNPYEYQVQGHCNVQLVSSNYGTSHPNGQWHNWIITTDINGTKFYIDGNLSATSSTFLNQTIVFGKKFVIGGVVNQDGTGYFYGDGNATPFNGYLDDIAIYNRALTQEEVTQLYTGCSTPLTSEFSVAACEQYQLPWGDSLITTTGDYLHTYQTVDGCDSNVTVHVTINHAVAGASFNATGISTYTLPWGEEVTSSGYYTHLYQNEYGCDSLVTAYVVINTPLNSNNTNVGINVENPQRSLHVKDVLRIEPRSTPPANPTKGDIYFDDTINKLRVYNGTGWDNL